MATWANKTRNPSTNGNDNTGSSKANSSDNWRASSKLAPQPRTTTAASTSTSVNSRKSVSTTDDQGWTTLERKPASSSGPGSHKPVQKQTHHGNKQQRNNHNNHVSNHQQSASSSRQPTLKSLPLATPDSIYLKPATSSSWADQVEGSAPLPSPTFETPSLPAVPAVPTPAEAELAGSNSYGLNDKASEPRTPKDDDGSKQNLKEKNADDFAPRTAALKQSEQKKKQPAPIPKVNVWSVRQEQLAKAAGTTSASSNSTVSSSAASPAVSSATSSNALTAPMSTTPDRSEVSPSAKIATRVLSPAEKKSASTEAEAIHSTRPQSTGIEASASSSTATSTTSTKRRPVEGWSQVPNKAAMASTTLPVLGGDVGSWPSPNEEPAAAHKDKSSKKGKGSSKLQNSSSHAQGTIASENDARLGKKKGDKTKWIPIKADITVNAPRPSHNGGEKRTKGPRKDSSQLTHDGANKIASGKAKKDGEVNVGVTDKAAAGKEVSNAIGKTSATQATSNESRNKATNHVVGDHPLPQKPVVASAPNTHKLVKSPKGSSTTPAKVTAAEQNQHAVQPTTANSQTIDSVPESSRDNRAEASQDTPALSTPSEALQDSSPALMNRGTSALHPHGSGRVGGAPRGARSGAARGRGGASRGGHLPTGPLQAAPFPMRTGPGSQSHPFPVFADQPMAPAFMHQAMAVDPSAAYQQVYPIGGLPSESHSYGVPSQPVDPRVLDPTRYWLLGQLEWYFGVDNLCRDLFLRSKMDAAGWIDVSIIASFNRIKNLTTDQSIVRDTMCFTPLLEVVDDYVRLRQHWPEWILPNAILSRISEERLAQASRMDPHQPMVHFAPVPSSTHPQANQALSSSAQPFAHQQQQHERVEPSIQQSGPGAAPAQSMVHPDPTSGSVDHEHDGHASSDDDEDGEGGTAATSMSNGSQAGLDGEDNNAIQNKGQDSPQAGTQDPNAFEP